MEFLRKNRKQLIWILTGTLTGVSLLVMYITHRYVPFMMDDLWYSTILSDETVPIASFNDIIQSQIWHYHNWGGRSMTHGLLQLILLTGEQCADILNILATLLLSWMICVVAQHKNLPAFFAATAMFLGLNANWKMSMFWQSGAANYLYITIFILLFIFCYLREFTEEAPRQLPGITLWIIPLAILAGWSNENMGPSAWILSLIVIGYVIRKKRKIHPWMVLGNLTCLFGSVMMIIAPGNFVRSAQVAENEYGTLWKFFLRCYAESKAALEYLFPTLLVLALVLFVAKSVLKLTIGKKNLLLLLCALLSWGAMVLSPHYPDRATFGTMVLLICVILSVAKQIIDEHKDLGIPLLGITLIIWLRGMFFCGEFLSYCWGWIK